MDHRALPSELAAEGDDVDVDGALGDADALADGGGDQLAAGEDAALGGGQGGEDAELGEGEAQGARGGAGPGGGGGSWVSGSSSTSPRRTRRAARGGRVERRRSDWSRASRTRTEKGL